MSTIETPPADYPAEIIGYADPWIASPGEKVAIKVSCTEPEYTYRVVRTIQGVDVDHSPKKEQEVISAIPAGRSEGRYQVARSGSYGLVKNWLLVPLSSQDTIKVSFYVQPWLPTAGHTQTLLSTLDIATKTGFAVVITDKGQLYIWAGTGETVEVISSQVNIQMKNWAKLSLLFDGPEVTISSKPISDVAEPCTGRSETFRHDISNPLAWSSTSSLVFGGSFAKDPNTANPYVTNIFNGRLDSPTIKRTGSNPITLVKYDFARNMRSDGFVDVSGHSCHGILVNAPTRGVRGHNWDGSEGDWTKVAFGYGAIHFHEDDLDDACWETDFTINLPPGLRSGAYAVELSTQDGKVTDSVPFIVRPSEKDWSQREGKVAFVLSTFTYLAYANEHLWDTNRSSYIELGPGFTMDDVYKSEDFSKMQRRHDLGLSCYDMHRDESGTVFSSSKRPILNMRPGYIMWGFKRPREFSADTIMIGYLEREKIPYEVITDHDLHERGVAAISGFNTVITGSHPEYPTQQSYQAFTAYARQGGNLMYLGGNGFYWVTAANMTANPHRIEVRRADAGVRTYTLPGGERVNTTDGHMGGLWRSRGKPCNSLFGIGFSGEGIAPGVPYARSELSRTGESVAWMFEGLSADGLIGEYGLGGGASGDEIDRFALEHGSPACVKVLASSTGHPDDFGLAPEEATFPIVNTLGTRNPNIRSDITYYTTSGGGGVFSVGSINWFCSLGWDDYQNTVAQLTGNVLKGLLRGLH